MDLDGLINRLLKPPRNTSIHITQVEVERICAFAKTRFLEQDTLLKIASPVKICGDIHGQFFDLLKLFDIGGCPIQTKYLFLGDYVDRGRNSLETICLLLALKCRYPGTVYLLRGNHEIAPINRIFGLYNEMRRRFRQKDFMKLYLKLNEVFNYIPLAAVIDEKVFCCHGGLSPSLKTLDCINAVKRPVFPSKTGLVSDLLWSDPDEDINGWEEQNNLNNPKNRGIGWRWGHVVHKEFLKKNKLTMVIRAHECVEDGYRWSFNEELLTIFSAPNYSEGNSAVVASYNQDSSLTFQKFK